jgi:hypothetical protein
VAALKRWGKSEGERALLEGFISLSLSCSLYRKDDSFLFPTGENKGLTDF